MHVRVIVVLQFDGSARLENICGSYVVYRHSVLWLVLQQARGEGDQLSDVQNSPNSRIMLEV